MTKLRTAVIGAGKIGHFHAKALSRLNSSEFVAVAGRDMERTRTFADAYGVTAYDDVATMVREERVEVVLICTPHPVHKESALAAIENGAHVLIEKPLASSLADCDAILSAAELAGVRVGTIAQRRFYTPSLRIRSAIDEGKIGKPILASAVLLGWRDRSYYESDPWRGSWEHEGGGVLINQAPHVLDMLLWFMGEAEEVYGAWRNFNHDYIEVDDTAVATVKFKGGGLASIILSNSQNPALWGKLHVHGDNGATVGVQTDGGPMFLPGRSSIAEAPYNDVWTVQGEEHLQPVFRKQDEAEFATLDATTHFHEVQIEDFLSAITNGHRPKVDGADGRRTVELIEAIYRSSKTGLPVQLPIKVDPSEVVEPDPS